MALFMSRFSLSYKCIKELLRIFKSLLPYPNSVKVSLNEIINLNKKIGKEKPIIEKTCSICWTNLNKNLFCVNRDCKGKNRNTNCLEVIYFNTEHQLQNILKRENEKIKKYYLSQVTNQVKN
jgi:hypothetical protein